MRPTQMLRLEDDDSLELRYLLVCAASQAGESDLATEEVCMMMMVMMMSTKEENHSEFCSAATSGAPVIGWMCARMGDASIAQEFSVDCDVCRWKRRLRLPSQRRVQTMSASGWTNLCKYSKISANQT